MQGGEDDLHLPYGLLIFFKYHVLLFYIDLIFLSYYINLLFSYVKIIPEV